MKKLTFIGIILALLIQIIGCTHKPKDKMEWWREARFGMFIHWGIYSVPAGVYQGKDIPGIGEWIMNNAEIPIENWGY
jgi:alpha-L-fucosidase